MRTAMGAILRAGTLGNEQTCGSAHALLFFSPFAAAFLVPWQTAI